MKKVIETGLSALMILGMIAFTGCQETSAPTETNVTEVAPTSPEATVEANITEANVTEANETK
jgi:hypothetical protein